MSGTPVASAAAAASAPRVHFQPSTELLAASESAMEDSTAPQSAHNGNGRSRRKSGNEKDRGAAPAAAVAVATAGNNTSAPAVSVKADRAARGVGGKKRLHTDTSANPSLSSWGQNASRSRSPGNRNRGGASGSDRHHDTPKKRPMRPIEDVMSRLRHEVGSGPDGEEVLAPFTVAYVDRVFGDQEVGFTEFFESEDTKDVPLHRISYMRYYDEIIWNRAARYDAVFGSSNSTKTLPDWLAQAKELKDAQELRWARLLAREALEEAAEQQLLARLAVQIREQRDEIEARNQVRTGVVAGDAVDTTSQAGSAFDFGEEEDEDMTDEEEQAKPAVMEDVAPAVVTQSSTQSTTTVSEPIAAQSGANGVTFEALPPRAARGARGQPAAAAPSAASAASAAAPAAASSAQGTSTGASASASSGSSRPLRDDDSHIVCTASLLASGSNAGDASEPKVLRSAPVRVSLDHFDWDFLRKRLARKLHVEGGARQVKRLYVQRADGTTTRLNADNFRIMLHNGAHMLLMQEQAPFPNREAAAAALIAAPKDADERAPSVSVVPPRLPPAAAAAAAAAPSGPPARPTHFISLRITSAPLLSTLSSIQSALTAFDSRYEPFLVPKGTFHLTISLLSLPAKPEQKAAAIETAIKTLNEAAPRIRQLLHGEAPNAASVAAASASTASCPLSLTLRGVSSFNDAVVFADVVRDEARARLSAVAGFLADEFEKAGVGSAANKRTGGSKKKQQNKNKQPNRSKHAEVAAPPETSSDAAAAAAAAGAGQPQAEEEQHESFTPHLTLAKLSRAAPAGKGKGKFDRKNKKKQQPRGAADSKEYEEDEAAGNEDAPMPPAQNPFDALQRDDSTRTVASEASAVNAVPPTPSQPIAADPAAAAAAGIVVRNPSTSVVRRLHAASYRAFQDAELGVQPIVSFDLCSMQDRKQADGYYAVLAQIDVSKPSAV